MVPEILECFYVLQIFNSGNIEQTFHLVFSVLCSSHGDFVGIRYAVDLFVHLLSCERVQEAIVKLVLCMIIVTTE